MGGYGSNGGDVPILVIGTREGSLGDYVCQQIKTTRFLEQGYSVLHRGDLLGVQGMTTEFDMRWSTTAMADALQYLRPHHVVCCAGINVADEKGGGTAASVQEHFEVNALGFVRLAEAFRLFSYPGSHLAVVSSNSARIPRSPSLGYCVSKAALSMAVQVLARKWAGKGPVTYGYEPGLLATDATITAVNSEAYGLRAMHRMPAVGPYGLAPTVMARHIANNLLDGGAELNGVLLKLDAGEL